MASASCLLSEEQFLCCICLDVFTNPVIITCGHNFCKTCITQFWDSNVLCRCPLCNELFKKRPELRVNTFISEMAAQFRKSVQVKANSCPDQQCAKPGEVPCDYCTETMIKAVKSCLVCLASYCETHLEPHQRVAGLKRHKLIDPVENLEDRMCKKHDRPLELFCKTEQMCVCQFCTESDHKLHMIVPLKEEYEGKKAQLGKTGAEVQQMIQERQLKIQEIKHSVQLSKEDADREIADSVEVFTALMSSIERSQAELIETIEEKQKSTEKKAEGFIKELEQEISELTKRSTELEQLSHTEDHLLQGFPTLNTPPLTKDWTKVNVHQSYVGTVRRAVAQLEKILNLEMEKLCDAELKRVQQYAVDVTLDPDTVHPNLILCKDGKWVNHGKVMKNLPDNPKRFSQGIGVLGKQSFSSGRFYFEVEVKGKTAWDFGMARESINRKGKITLSPEDGFWILQLRNGNEYKAFDGPDVLLSLRDKLQKVGVFVDYDEGLVSFYDVEARVHIYSYTGCTFSETLYPLFSPSLNHGGKNSAPLIISPVNHTGMASASSLLSEEQFLCSICLDVFTNPVTTACGHNFCKTCITQHWDSNVLWRCPLCNEQFNRRPELRVNTFISEMAAQFTKSVQVKDNSCPDQQCAKPGEVLCDFCTETMNKAVKSCLVCLGSYCETHLEPHQRVAGLKRHKLIDPVENLEDRMCKKHDRPLEMFCKTEQMCVCQFCTESDHKFHLVVPLKEEYEGKKAQLGKTGAEVQQMIQERQLKIQEIKHSVQLSKEDTDREIVNSVEVFTALMSSIERSQAEVIETIEEKQKSTEKKAEGLIKELEQEISDLTKRSTELEQLSLTEDHLHLLQGFPTLNTPPLTKDWTKVKVQRSSFVGTVRRAVAQLEKTLNLEMKKLCDAELKRVQQYAVDVTLDPDTALTKLILSEDEKQVYHGDIKKNLPDNPKRFSQCACVLGKQSFSSGRFYFEVEVKGKTAWDLGMVRESINRKSKITLNPEDGFWTIWLRNGNEYKALDDPVVLLSLRDKLQKVGVFVDHDEGLVSFYDVEARVHIYSFIGCSFSEPLYPLFSPCNHYGGKNSAPLIISPVNHTD
ncbi:uncharacterized protein ACJ7VT_010698 [Polymixia lowei]